MFWAAIICGPVYGRMEGLVKMWSWVLFVRPSRRRLMERRRRPHALLVVAGLEDLEEEEEGWWRVKIATPAVTRRTTRYL